MMVIRIPTQQMRELFNALAQNVKPNKKRKKTQESFRLKKNKLVPIKTYLSRYC
jgi:hypothetical protein